MQISVTTSTVAQFSRAQVEDGARLSLNYASGFTVAVDYGGDVSSLVPPSSPCLFLCGTVMRCGGQVVLHADETVRASAARIQAEFSTAEYGDPCAAHHESVLALLSATLHLTLSFFGKR